MKRIPKIGDTVEIKSHEYNGLAIVTYIDQANIFNHEFRPIQVEILPEDLAQFEENNHNHDIVRFSLPDIKSIIKK